MNESPLNGFGSLESNSIPRNIEEMSSHPNFGNEGRKALDKEEGMV